MTKSQRKRDRHEIKIKMAAFHFNFTTRDGAVICQLTRLNPRELHNIFKDETGVWIDAIRFWHPSYYSTGEIEGEYYHYRLNESQIARGLKHVRVLWEELLGIKAVTSRLKNYIHRLDHYNGEIFDVDNSEVINHD